MRLQHSLQGMTYQLKISNTLTKIEGHNVFIRKFRLNKKIIKWLVSIFSLMKD